jgi:arylsulfatase A-like enzyme/Tfp pilus assembly protein PilF
MAASRRAPSGNRDASSPSRRKLAALVGLAMLAVALALAAGLGRRPAPTSLLLVTIDTLRADRVGAYGYAEPTTPVLDALAARGVRFEQAQSAAPLTGPSHATILTGHYPPVHGVRDNARFALSERTRTLAELLRDRGYETAAFVAAYPLAGAFGFARGFASFDEGLHASASAGGVAQRSGDEVADAAGAWLRARTGRPFFAWMHLFDPHEPYQPPSPFRERFASGYDGEVAFADAQLGRVLDALRDSGRLERTLVAVLSDHGEGLGEHGETTHGLLLYESTLRVPLVLAGPGVPGGRVVRERVGTIDLFPTLGALLGMELPEGLPGRDLRRSFEGGTLPGAGLYSESLYGRLNCRWAPLRGWTRRGVKLVEGGRSELYELEADPGERRDRSRDEAARTTGLREELSRTVAAMAPGGDRAEPRAVSGEAAERLRALGYVAGGGGGGELDAPGLPDPRDRLLVFERLRALSAAAGPALAPALVETAAIGEQEPQNPFAQEVLAGLAQRAGRLDLAAGALERFLAIEPARADARARYGALLSALGEPARAAVELRRVVTEVPDDLAARTSLAEALVATGELGEARTLLDEVLAREPRQRPARLARGRLHVAEGRPPEAARDFEAAAEAGETDAWLELGELRLREEHPEAARQAASRVLAGSPAHPWALAITGHARVLEGARAEGEALLQQALRAGPRRQRVWLRLAEGFEAAGRNDLARRCRAAALTRRAEHT